MEKLLESIKQSAAQVYAQLKDLYLSMTFGNRVVATLLLATLLFSLGYLIVGSVPRTEPGSKMTYVYNGEPFDRIQQRAAESALATKGLRGHNWVGDKLQVPTDKQHLYIGALAEKSVMVPSSTPKQLVASALTAWQPRPIIDAQLNAATELTCVLAIKTLPGIADAMISSTKRPEWDRNTWVRKWVTSVSVGVEAIDNMPLPPETITAIGNIVAPAFGITNRKDIGIVDTRHAKSYDGLGEEVGSSQGEYLRYQLKTQAEWEKIIRGALPPIVGLDVKTSVRLTTHRELKSFEVEHGKPTALVGHELDYQFRKEGYDRWWRPGQIAQWSRPQIDPTGNFGPRDLVDERKREVETTNALQGTETDRVELPYIPTAITAMIRIPYDYVEDVWRQDRKFERGDATAQPSKEELAETEAKITRSTKQSVAILIKNYLLTNKQDPMELVNVEYFHRMLPVEVELTAWEQFVLFLKENWQNLGLMSLVFCGMAVLYLISKPQKPDSVVLYEGPETPMEAIDARLAEKIRLEEERLAAEAAAAAAAAEEEEFENSLGGLGSIRSLRDEIAELIAKNPEAAAAVIRQWVGNAVLVEAKS